MNTYIELVHKNSINNKYKKWYVSIIENATERVIYNSSNPRTLKKQIDYYTEGHHILPQCLCNENQKKDIKNYVFLTAREHFVCHWLLCKMFGGEEKIKMWYALHRFRFASSNQERKLTSVEFDIIKKTWNAINRNKEYSQEFRDATSMRFKGGTLSEEHKRKIGDSNKGKTKGISRPHTNIQNVKIGLSLSGIPKSDSHKEQLRKANLGKKKPLIKCLICGREIGNNNIKRHIEKCNGSSN